jgi:diketogulonate reductase-like aldo/keto reductase
MRLPVPPHQENDCELLTQRVAAAMIPPVVNQVRFSPFEYRRAVLEHALQRHVAVEAYRPLGTGRHLANETVRRNASRVGHTLAPVLLLRWSLQHGLVVISKSTHRERLEE